MTWLAKVRALFFRQQVEREMQEEMRAHLAEQTQRNVAAGMRETEARAAARRQFGGVAQIQERARDARGWTWLEQAYHDVRFAARALRRHPGFSAVVVFTLALGLGLTTIVFSFYHTLVGKRLAVRDPEQILRVSAHGRQFQAPFTHDEFDDLRARLHSVDAIVAASPLQVMLVSQAGEAEERQRPAAVQLVSENYLSALGVPAVLGRTFAPGETDVTVISYDGWQRRFNGDRAILGRTVALQGVPVTIVGVAPPRFGGTTPPAAPDFWLPMELQPRLLPNVDWLHDPSVRVWQLLVRRRPTVSPALVGAEIDVVAHTWKQPDDKPLQTRVRPATFFQLDGPEVHAVCVTLLLAVGLILLVGCVNVVNLIFARTIAREQELAVRFALGGGRGRLLRQLCTETILLGLLGGIAGMLLTWWSAEAIHVGLTSFMRSVTGGTWSPFLDLTPDARVFGFALFVSLLTSVLVGLRPALRGANTSVGSALKRQGADAGGPGGFGRRNHLLAVQVAACLLLLAGAGLLLRGARRALTTDPGFDAKHLLGVVAWSNLPTATPSPADQLRRAGEIDARLRTVPGVASVAGADREPFSGHSISAYITDDGTWVNQGVAMKVDRDYFATLGLRLVSGRSFTADEVVHAAPVVIITQSAARHLWPEKDPLGRSIRSAAPGHDEVPSPAFTVIGVIPDARFTDLSKTDSVDLFFPQSATAHWLVRTQGNPSAVIPSIYAALAEIDPALRAQTAIWTLEEGPMRVQYLFAAAPATMASVLGAIALALAAVGVFGVVSFTVARRTREFGIRLALGAQRRDVILLVLRQTLRPVVWGVAVGLAGAGAISILLTRLVLSAEVPDFSYGAGAFPIATFGSALAVLLLVIAIASWLPARRAAKVDPVEALRAE